MALYPSRTEPFDQVLDNFLGGRMGGALMRSPETDVVETDREIRVVAEMPGLSRDNIEVDVENNVLTIRGEKREERTEGEEGRFHLSERRYGTFTRSFVLPSSVNADNIQASFDDGVLRVTIPKSEQALKRRIEVAHEDGPKQVLGGKGEQPPTGEGETPGMR